MPPKSKRPGAAGGGNQELPQQQQQQHERRGDEQQLSLVATAGGGAAVDAAEALRECSRILGDSAAPRTRVLCGAMSTVTGACREAHACAV